MHSLAIFVGTLVFGWGVANLKMAFVLAKLCTDNKGPWESFWDRWTPNLITVIMLLLPLAILAGGGFLLRWGVLGV